MAHTILVLGGAGYIGSHTVMELLESGYNMVVVDSLEKGHRSAVAPEAVFYEGDLRDGALMERVFSENSIDAVIDFAAYSLVGESVLEPLKYYENNVNGMLCLQKSMMKHRVNKIVFSSTAATYGEPVHIPILESDPTRPTSPYGETKLAVEKIMKWFDVAYGLKYVALRYFNAAGAHASGKIGEDHTPETHLIPITLQVALGKRDILEMYGSDYDTPDGTCVRDYIHVTDLANAHVLAVEKLIQGGESAIYNLGSGQGYSNKQIVDMAEQVVGRPIPVEITDRRPGDPGTLIASSDKIISELGWKPKYQDLKQIIETAWVWHKNHPEGYTEK